MSYYINCPKLESTLSRDIKELIPSMNQRRRMSRVVKLGVTTALDALLDFEPYGTIDAIVTATHLGCIADSEKFLANIITDDERMLNPTPFIQSTFNTVGAQVALIRGLHCYNNTITHGAESLHHALIDAVLQLASHAADHVLVGSYDEETPTVRHLAHRLRTTLPTDGALFFVLTRHQLPCSVARLEAISLDHPTDTNTLRHTLLHHAPHPTLTWL